MPKQPQLSSTVRRHRLCEFIEVFGDTMVQKCSTCVKHNRVCKVHVRSGKCSECLRRGQRCNVRVTESEFRRLATEKEKLRARIQETREAQSEALKASEKALEDLRVARAREERLRQQMDLLDRRADEAIAVEERGIAEQELTEETMAFDGPSEGLALNLSPSTWGAFDGLPLDYWDENVALPDWPVHIPSTSAGSS
jgi:galactokinase